MTLTELNLLIRQKSRFILVSAIATAIVFFVLGQLLIRYEASATILIRPLGPLDSTGYRDPIQGLIFSPLWVDLKDMKQGYIELLNSRRLFRQVLQQLDGTKNPGPPATPIEWLKNSLRILVYGRIPTKQDPLERQIDKDKNNISAKFLGNSPVVRIIARDSNPNRAVALANGMLDAFARSSSARRDMLINRVQNLINTELTINRSNINNNKSKLNKLIKKIGLEIFSDIKDERNIVLKKYYDVRSNLEKQSIDIPLIKKRLQRVETNLKKFPKFQRVSYKLKINNNIQDLKNQLLALKIQKLETLIDYGKNSLRIKSLDIKMGVLTSQLSAEVKRLFGDESYKLQPIYTSLIQSKFDLESQLEAYPSIAQSLTARMKEYRRRLIDLKAVENEESMLSLEKGRLDAYGEELRKRLSRVVAYKRAAAQEIEILDRATLPRYPMLRNAPLITIALLGMFLGLLVSIGISVLREETRSLKNARINADHTT